MYSRNDKGDIVDKESEELKEWIIENIKHKDIFQKKIVKIEEKGEQVIVEYKDKTHYFVIMPHIKELNGIITDFAQKHISLVVYNTMENLEAVIKNWARLSELPMLNIYFVNPHSAADKRWIIYPFTHNKITEDNSLRRGMLSMFESVEEYKGHKVL